MDVYFSTIVRGAPLKQAGELIRLNWNTKEIEACTPMYPDQPEVDDPNPRGNSRGGRGITFVGDQVMCASWHSLIFYDKQLNEKRRITHNNLVDLHEVSLEDDGTIYVSITGLDAAFQIDLVTGDILKEYHARDDVRIQRALGVEPLEFDRNADNRIVFVSRPYKKEHDHLHINTVTRYGGETYVLCNHQGAILNLDRSEVTLKHPGLKGAHNLVFTEDHIYSSGTYEGKIYRYNRHTNEADLVINLADFPSIRKLKEKAEAPTFDNELRDKLRSLKKTPLRVLKHTPLRKLYYKMGLNQKSSPALPLFVRGLDVVDGHIFAGFSPASIGMFDANTGQLVDMFQYSHDVTNCIHGLKVDPATV